MAGGGRLVGDVTIAPVGAGPDSGEMTVDDGPGYGDEITDRRAWAERTPIQGLSAPPGRYLVFAQVQVPPEDPLEGLDFAWFDSNATGSSPLVVSVKVRRKGCKDRTDE